MPRQLVFIPVSRDELACITGAVVLADRPAHMVTPDLLAELGYEPGATEDAEYAALVLASVASLASHGERLVLVAEIPSDEVTVATPSPNGECVVARVPVPAMTCWFGDPAGTDIADAAAAASGLDIDTAWDFPQVQDLLNSSDLLWNDVEEYRRSSSSGKV